MKEYSIYIRQGSGTPYMIHFFNNIDSAKIKLYEMIDLEEKRERPYFVENDFFDNKYNISTEKSNKEDNKIIYFNKNFLTK